MKTKKRVKAKKQAKSRKKPVSAKAKKRPPLPTPIVPEPLFPSPPKVEFKVNSLSEYRAKVAASYERANIPPHTGDEVCSAYPDSEWVWNLRRMALKDGTLVHLYLRDLWNRSIGNRWAKVVQPLRDLKVKVYKRFFRSTEEVRKEADEKLVDEILGWMRFSSGQR